MKPRIIAVLITCIALFGCAGGPKETGGSVVGGVAGALLGSTVGKGNGRLVAVALGTLIGSQVGGSIGRQMDETDRRLAAKSTFNALENAPNNQSVGCKNPNNSHSGTTVATSTVQDGNTVCRDYIQTVVIGGQQEEIVGRACRDVRDIKGEWVKVN